MHRIGLEAAMPLTDIDDAVALIRMEYEELPGLKLTTWQVQRLWNLPRDVCLRALGTLLESQYLARTADGSYRRRVIPAPPVTPWEALQGQRLDRS
jgi:hypothetical protein